METRRCDAEASRYRPVWTFVTVGLYLNSYANLSWRWAPDRAPLLETLEHLWKTGNMGSERGVIVRSKFVAFRFGKVCRSQPRLRFHYPVPTIAVSRAGGLEGQGHLSGRLSRFESDIETHSLPSIIHSSTPQRSA